MKWLKLGIFLLILFIFFYLRLTPIIDQTVPYTYDQGRDFLKAEEIGRYHNLTFIGPTTGIMGLYHGAWWYYMLTAAYLLFNGLPLGFYFFMLVISIIGNLLFFLFLKKEFNFKTALLFLTIVSISPYFIPLSFFASNNIIVPYLILALIAALYKFFQKGSPYYLFFIALSLGFIFEFEVAFGLFLIPAFLIVSLFFKQFRKKLFLLKNLPVFFSGFVIPLIPRILFEIKHQFTQTKTLINFFFNPKLYNPKQFIDVFNDRIGLFRNYFKGIFYNYSPIIALAVLLLTILLLIKYRSKKNLYTVTLFFITTIAFLFSGSLFYKDNFWSNYYEGIQYLFLFIILTVFYLFSKIKKNLIFSYLVLAVFITIATFAFSKDVLSKNKPSLIGLKPIDLAVNYVYNQVGKQDFCLRIYTPPVVPYTYNYLIGYYSRIKNLKQPKIDFADNKCLYIIENDPYQFRIDKWRKENVPQEAELIDSQKIGQDISIELWSANNR